MARLSKAQLFDHVAQALESSGWDLRLLSNPGDHPIRFAMSKGKAKHNVRVYIWNLTHGGGEKRPLHEYRIQATGSDEFELEPRGKTLILGWSDKARVLAAFDASRRIGPHGKSPSLQISERTLKAARKSGAATQDKKGDIAVALRPNALPSYIGHIRDAHSGDLTKIIADYQRAKLDEEELLARAASKGTSFDLGTEEELAQRRTIEARLEALERKLTDLDRQPANRGHNNPPELLPTEGDSAVAAEVDRSAKKIRRELAKKTPDVPAVATETRILRSVKAAVRGTKNQVAKMREALSSEVRALIATIIVGGATPYLKDIAALIEAAVTELVNWLHIIS